MVIPYWFWLTSLALTLDLRPRVCPLILTVANCKDRRKTKGLLHQQLKALFWSWYALLHSWFILNPNTERQEPQSKKYLKGEMTAICWVGQKVHQVFLYHLMEKSLLKSLAHSTHDYFFKLTEEGTHTHTSMLMLAWICLLNQMGGGSSKVNISACGQIQPASCFLPRCSYYLFIFAVDLQCCVSFRCTE